MNKPINQLSFLLHTNLYVLLILSFFILSKSTFSQTINFEPAYYNITTETGLPSLETYAVKQDSKGFVWICTDGGVSRYDGFEFKNYTISDGLTDNVVFDVYEDFKGRIWFLTYNSLLCYFENGVIKPYEFNNVIEPIVKNKSIISRSFSIDKNENIYYELFNCGIVKINKFGKLEKLISTSSKFSIAKINKEYYITRNVAPIVKDNSKARLDSIYLKLEVNGKLMIIRCSGRSLHYHIPKNENKSESNYFLFGDHIYERLTGREIYSENGILHFVIHKNDFWICTSQGLKRGKLIDGKIKIYNEYLSGSAVSNIAFFKDGSMWVSTLNSGVFYFNKFNFSFSGMNSGLVSPEIIHIGQFQNDIFVSGINYLQNISSRKLFDFQLDYSGQVRFETVKNKLLIRSEVFKQLRILQNNIYGSIWVSSLVACDSLIYSLKGASVYEFNANSGKEREIYNGYSNKYGKGQLFLHKITLNEKKELIIASKNELFILKDDQLIPLQLPIKNRIDINSLNFHKKWGLIIGTSGNGIILFKNNRIRLITAKNGLLSDIINTIEIANDAKLFVGSPNGMSIIKLDGKIGVFGRNQALYSTDINTIYLDDKAVFIGTKSGLFKLNTSVIEQCFQKTKLAKVKLATVLFDKENAIAKNRISFPYESTLLQLNFQVFQFTNWYSKQYQYKIGELGEWVDIESPSISLYRPVGNFKIFIRYMDEQYKWSKPVFLCSVNVIVPFWKQWYFWTIIAFIVLFILFFFYQRSQRRIQEKLIYESQMLSLEQQMQNARMNPHFVFNVLNSIHSYVLNQELEKADDYLMKFSKLMREILRSTKEGVIKIDEEISILKKYLELEQLRHQNSFEFSFSQNDINGRFKIPSMMIQPFVENAILYSDANGLLKSFIKVKFEKIDDSCIQVSISNSGVPSDESLLKMQELSTKNAIGITRKRLLNYNQLLQSTNYGIEIKIIDGISTTIILKIPVIKNQN